VADISVSAQKKHQLILSIYYTHQQSASQNHTFTLM